jgi:hypothetical protein
MRLVFSQYPKGYTRESVIKGMHVIGLVFEGMTQAEVWRDGGERRWRETVERW